MAIKSASRARRFSAIALSIAALALGFVSIAGAANAAPAGHSMSKPAAQDCSYDLSTKALTCVKVGGDLNAAVLAQQHLRVAVPAGAVGKTPLAAASPDGVLTTYVLTQLYDDAGYGGSFFQITNSSQCDGSTVWYYGPLDNVGWNGRVSSFKSFSACTTKVWQGMQYTGAAYGYNVNASSLGAMNDQAHSVTMK